MRATKTFSPLSRWIRTLPDAESADPFVKIARRREENDKIR